MPPAWLANDDDDTTLPRRKLTNWATLQKQGARDVYACMEGISQSAPSRVLAITVSTTMHACRGVGVVCSRAVCLRLSLSFGTCLLVRSVTIDPPSY